MNESDEEQIVNELRGFLTYSEPVPPQVAAKVEAAIRREAQWLTTVSWADATTLLWLVFLIIGSVLPWSLTLPALGIGCLGAGLYALSVRRILREPGAFTATQLGHHMLGTNANPSMGYLPESNSRSAPVAPRS